MATDQARSACMPRQASPEGIGASATAALLACGLFITIGLFSPGLVLPQIATAFAATPHAELLTELVGAIASFAFALGAPVAGSLIGRFGCRRVILPALALFALLGTLPAVLDSLWTIVASRALLGLATAAIFTAALAGIGALDESLRTRLFGWFAMVSGTAAIVLFPIVGILGHSGWRLAFVVHLSSLLVIPVALAIPVTLGRRHDDGNPSASMAQVPAREPRLDSRMIGLLPVAALAGMSMMVAPIYGPIYLATLGLSDTRQAAIPLTLGAIAAVFASACYGAVNRRMGVAGVTVASTTGIGLALVFAGMTGNVIAFMAALVAVSALLALLGPNLNASAVAFSASGRAGQAIGLANGAMFGSQLLFPFMASWIRGMAGLNGVFLGFGLIMIVVGLTALAATRRAGPARLSA